MGKSLTQQYVDHVVSQAASNRIIYGAVLCVENSDDSLQYLSSAGNFTNDQPYFITSVTKLYVTAVLLNLKWKNRLILDDPIAKYLSDDILHNLHVYKGIDYSKKITVKHLLSNTSGIPDYYDSILVNELLRGQDQSWGFDRVIARSKQLKPKFVPGQRASYCDTNFQLLGRIIENITDKPLEDVFQHTIFNELQLEYTSFYKEQIKPPPLNIYYKDKSYHLPKYLASIGPEGGIVSTAKESMIFLKAFFNGRFFPTEYFNEMKQWRIVFAPGLFYYGIGISRQPLSILHLGKGLLGQWGHSGAFAFYHPETNLYFTGTVNQYIGHSKAIKMILDIIKAAQS